MKKVFFIFVFAGLAVVVFHSCRKDKVQSPTNEEQEISYTDEELSIWRNLTAFNQKIKSGVRDEEFISPDSAMWYLEALFNVTEASHVTYNKFVTDTTFYSLPFNENGEVSLTDVSSVYNQMITNMQYTLDKFEENYKYLILGDIYNANTNRAGSAEIGLISGYGLNVLALYNELTERDNWYYGNVLGMCNGDSLWDSDAGFELERRFNNPYINYNPPHDTAHAFDIVTRDAFYNEYSDYMYNMKWIDVSSSDTCVYYQDLQYYLVMGHDTIIYNYEANGGERPAGKDFFVVDVWTNAKGPIYPSNEHYDSIYFHNYNLFYANFRRLPHIGD